MSVTEILTIGFGLFIGYWVVSKLFTERRPEGAAPGEDQASSKEESAAESSSKDSKEWYEILNVSRNATMDDIRQSYKVLMRQYHPDKVASLGDELKALAERKSKEINGAYDQAVKIRGVSP